MEKPIAPDKYWSVRWDDTLETYVAFAAGHLSVGFKTERDALLWVAHTLAATLFEAEEYIRKATP